jgi:hypothetical protein
MQKGKDRLLDRYFTRIFLKRNSTAVWNGILNPRVYLDVGFPIEDPKSITKATDSTAKVAMTLAVVSSLLHHLVCVNIFGEDNYIVSHKYTLVVVKEIRTSEFKKSYNLLQ